MPSPLDLFFFFNDTATTEIYTLSLHDALPISTGTIAPITIGHWIRPSLSSCSTRTARSEEHTSELQSPDHLVCRLLLEKKVSEQLRAQPRVTTRVDGDRGPC